MKFTSISFYKIISLSILALFWALGSAQNGDNNIYSRFGIGNIELQGNPIQMGAGGTGVSNPNLQCVNFLNPASLAYLPMTTFQASGALKQSTYSYQDQSSKILTGYLKDVALGFRKPGSKWGFALGMQPYSFVNYNASAQVTEADSLLTTYTYKGKGGLNKATVGFGRKFVFGSDSLASGKRKILTVGLNTHYFFGTIEHSSKTSFDDFGDYERGRYSQNHFLNGFQPELGLLFTLPIVHSKDANQKLIKHQELVFGATLGLNTTLHSRSIYIEELLYGGNQSDFSFDTTYINEEVKFKFKMPQQIRLGLTWNLYHNKAGDFQISAEYMQQDWSHSQMNLSSEWSETNRLGASNKFFVGASFTPENSVQTNTFRHCTYRLGYSKGQSYQEINGITVEETAYTMGFTIPILKSLNKIHLGAAYTTAGTNDSSLLASKGMFYQIGFTFIPREPWFFQRKYD